MNPVRKVTPLTLSEMKQAGRKIVALTAYDFRTAQLIDECDVDVVLVGDSVGMTTLGYDSTLPVTMEEIIHHTRAVRRATRRALLVSDMPFGSFHTSAREAVTNAIRLVKEGGAEAVKVEGGAERTEVIRRICESEIPVMGHLGLTPQSVLKRGGYHVQAREAEAARQLLRAADELVHAGVFSIVLEAIPRKIAALVTARVPVPTIGIGAGGECDGQILVVNDLLGLTPDPLPRFVRTYASLAREIQSAVSRYANDVREGNYPAANESYELSGEIDRILEELRKDAEGSHH